MTKEIGGYMELEHFHGEEKYGDLFNLEATPAESTLAGLLSYGCLKTFLMTEYSSLNTSATQYPSALKKPAIKL